MLPKISLTPEQEATFKTLRLIGDLAYQAGELSITLLEAAEGDVGQTLKLDRAVVAKALIGQNLLGIPDASQKAFLQLAYRRQQFKRAVILHVVDHVNAFDFSELEKVVLRSYLESAHLFDKLCDDWMDVVVYSELGQKALADPGFMTNFRKEHGLSLVPYVFSVIAEDNGRYFEQALVKAFPEVVNEIIKRHQQLVATLRSLQSPAEWIAYADALVAFFENTDPAAYEGLSKQLDTLFLHIPGRLVPLHAMEVYQDPGKYCVTPEMRLCILDDRFKHVNDGIERTRENVIRRLGEVYGDVPAYHQSVPLMRRARAAAYTTISEAGASLTLRPFGENIPNWDDVRVKEGIMIFIFMETAKTRWVGERAVLQKLLGEDVVKAQFDPYIANEKLFDYAGIVAVGGHEVAHNAFIVDGVQDRLTPPYFAKLEEHKANLSILSEIDNLYDEEEQKIIALYELGYSLMKMAQASDTTVVAYVNYATFAINTFAEAGVIKQQGELLVLDISPETVKKWVGLAKQALADLVPIYDHGTPAEAAAYMNRYFTRGQLASELVQQLA